MKKVLLKSRQLLSWLKIDCAMWKEEVGNKMPPLVSLTFSVSCHWLTPCPHFKDRLKCLRGKKLISPGNLLENDQILWLLNSFTFTLFRIVKNKLFQTKIVHKSSHLTLVRLLQKNILILSRGFCTPSFKSTSFSEH